MTDPKSTEPEPSAEVPQDDDFKFCVGDKLIVPCHAGHYVAVVVHRYRGYSEACKEYQGSFDTILQSPFGKADPAQPHYYCQVDNSTHQPVGVAEEHAELKWRPSGE